MSNMTLKDWRENAGWLARRAPKRRDSAALREYLMLIATLLSAVATACTGAIAYYQYQTAYDQLTAADRNRTFEGFLISVHQMCNVLADKATRLSDLNDNYGPDSDDVFRSFGTDLRPALEELRTKLGVLSIWADKRQQRLVMDFYDDVVVTVEQLKADAVPEKGKLREDAQRSEWVLALLLTTSHCANESASLVEKYRGDELLQE